MGDDQINVYSVDETTCVGCNLCSFVCPVAGCIDMVSVASEIPDMTWRQYQQKLSADQLQPLPPPSHVKQP
jgi:Fe-S-cluster-containing hydrogenase component 2